MITHRIYAAGRVIVMPAPGNMLNNQLMHPFNFSLFFSVLYCVIHSFMAFSFSGLYFKSFSKTKGETLRFSLSYLLSVSIEVESKKSKFNFSA